MNEKPILFNGEMVRAILDGRKTQTRRVIKPQPNARHHRIDFENGELKESIREVGCWHVVKKHKCPYGEVGDRLWVRETYCLCGKDNPDGTPHTKVIYRADPETEICHFCGITPKPSIHMPRWASRINLIIKDIRIERVQDIADDDCYAEGIDTESDGCAWAAAENASIAGVSVQGGSQDRYAFIDLWNSINEKRCFGWDENPWVWVIEFERVKQ